MATLAEIRAKLAEQQNRGNTSNTGESGPVYRHWDLQTGKDSTVRFLPDKDTSNIFFWKERQLIKLPFPGIKGQADSKPCIVQVPCIEMYDSKAYCPILSEVRPWYKDDSLKEMANKYWKKRSFIMQGFVVKDGLNEQQPPENPIRRFVISPQIFPLIKALINDVQVLETPTDYLLGLDFTIAKTSKGDFADYTTSSWSRRERALSEVELAAIEKYDLFDLKEFLPKRPGDVELKVMKEMFEASVDGEAYDLDRWGQYYRPAGVEQSTGDTQSATFGIRQPTAVAPEVYTEAVTSPWDDQPVTQQPAYTAPPVTTVAAAPETVSAPAEGGNSKAQDIIAKIRARQAEQ